MEESYVLKKYISKVTNHQNHPAAIKVGYILYFSYGVVVKYDTKRRSTHLGNKIHLLT